MTYRVQEARGSGDPPLSRPRNNQPTYHYTDFIGENTQCPDKMSKVSNADRRDWNFDVRARAP